MQRGTRHHLLLVIVAALLASCARSLPPRVDPPASGPLVVGVAYGVVVYCSVPEEIGSRWWSFDEPMGNWPADISIPPFPLNIWTNVSSPYAVPGIVTLTTPEAAVFRADVDGSEFRLTGHDQNPEPGNACL